VPQYRGKAAGRALHRQLAPRPPLESRFWSARRDRSSRRAARLRPSGLRRGSLTRFASEGWPGGRGIHSFETPQRL